MSSNSVPSNPRPTFLAHVHAARVNARTLLFTRTFGLGLIALVLVGVLVTTGVFLGLHYVPTATGAYASIVEIEHAVALGSTVRAMHRWAADALLVVIVLHLLRIIAMAAYHRRGGNWLVGLGLGCAALLSAFSGYVLPWDQRAYWGARVVFALFDFVPWLGAFCGRLLFGDVTLGPAAVGRLHALHVTALPALLVTLVMVHLWRLRRDGGLARQHHHQELVPARPHLYTREIVVALITLSVLILTATCFAAPLGAAADLTRPDNPEKAPWYFLGLQELASRAPVLMALTLPLLAVTLVALMPFVDRDEHGVAVYVPNLRERLAYAAAVVLALATFTLTYAWAPAFSLVTTWVPLLLVLTTLGVTSRLLGRRAALRTSLVIWLTLYVLSTYVGARRAADWLLRLPWQEASFGL